MKLVYLIYYVAISSLSFSNILSNSIFELDTKDYSSIDSIVKYKQTYPKKALEFGFDSLKSFSEDDELTLEFVNINYYIGETFYHLQDYVSSYEYLKKSLELYELLDKRKRRNRKVSKPPWILTVMGAVYFKNKDFDNAIKFYNEAIENFLLFDPQYEDEKVYGLNTTQESLALIEIEKGNFDNAEKLYNLSLSRKDDNLGKMYSNRLFVELYILSNKLNYAEEYYNKVKLSFENKGRDNRPEFGIYFGEANLIFGKYFKDKLNFKLAYEYFSKAKEIFSEVNIDSGLKQVNYEIADLLISNNQFNEAEDLILSSIDYNNSKNSEKISYYKLLEKIYLITNRNDLLIASKDSIIAYNENPMQFEIQSEFNLLENLIIVSDKQNELNLSKSRTSLIILISIFSSISLLFLILFLRNNVELQRQKNYKLKYEKSLIKNELKLKKRELFSKINFISQRNEHIKNIKDKISKDVNNPSNIKNLENEIKHLNTSNKVYKEFDKMFSQVYPKFYKKLNSKYKLSQTDIRLASYIKMNHNNHEISRISGISMRTVESQRYRLSKKLNLKKGVDLLRENDVLFNGDMQKWKQLANSLKLRMALRAHGAPGEDFASSAVSEAISSGVLADSDALFESYNQVSNIWVEHSSYGDIYYGFGDAGQWKVGEPLINALSSVNDPRLSLMSKPSAGGTVTLDITEASDTQLAFLKSTLDNAGLVLDTDYSWTQTSNDLTITMAENTYHIGLPVRLSPNIKSLFDGNLFSSPADIVVNKSNEGKDISPFVVMSAADSHFMIAEAIVKGLASGDAAGHYQTGLEHAMNLWNTSITSDFSSSNMGKLTGSIDEKLEKIATQRWIANYTNGYEAWSIVRDTGYPISAITTSTDNSIRSLSGEMNGGYANRLRYISSAYTSNGDNIQSAVAKQGPDIKTTKLWWAK